jgi:hypothetical protein
MEKEYFYLDGETKVGPLTLYALRYAPLKPDTLIWNSTLPEWTPAGAIPELATLFAPAPPSPYEPAQTFDKPAQTPDKPAEYNTGNAGNTSDNAGSAAYNAGGTSYNTGNTAYNSGGTYTSPLTPPMPESYLVWAILTTVFCCIPFGIASILSANKVTTAYAAGDYEGAQNASQNAKKWAIWGAASAAVVWLLYIIVVVVVTLIGVAANS